MLRAAPAWPAAAPLAAAPRLARRLRGAPPPAASADSAAAAERGRFFADVAALAPADAARAELLVAVLAARGAAPAPPAARDGLHPGLLPLAELPGGAGVAGLLRWPSPGRGMELPVVAQLRGAPSLTLLARSPDEFVHRALAEEEEEAEAAAAGGSGAAPGPVARAAGAAGAALYEPGARARSGLPSLAAYLARRAGMFPDVAEALAAGHLARGDEISALITAEWYSRPEQLPGWGRPAEYTAALLAAARRPEEARDTARAALRAPWWTLRGGFAGARDAAGLAGGAADVRAALDAVDEMANGGALAASGFRTNPKTDAQRRLDAAAALLDRAAAGEAAWGAVAAGAAAEYRMAGLGSLARFIAAAAE
jgi:hypothetical protein